MNRTRHLIACGMAALSLVAAGCGDEETSEESAAKNSSEESSEPAAPAEESAPATAEAKPKPKVAVPAQAPSKLVIEDLEEGTGPAVKSGDTIAVNYVGVGLQTKKEFDSSFGREPFQLQLGAGMVIPGWDQGIVGMKVGGRRQLVIPAELAYGPQGSPDGSIKPNEPLTFVIDLLARQ